MDMDMDMGYKYNYIHLVYLGPLVNQFLFLRYSHREFETDSFRRTANMYVYIYGFDIKQNDLV